LSEKNKEELIAACIKGGMAEADCRLKLTDAVPKASTDADLMRENSMLRAEVEARKNQIKQATDLVTRVNQERKAAEDAEKNRLIDTIMADSAYTKDQLVGMDLKDLQTINTTLKLNNNKTFAAVAADIAAQEQRAKVQLTAGAWDAVEKKWVGGL
jgi:hypothetical protein